MRYEDLPLVHKVRGMHINGSVAVIVGALLLIGAWSWLAVAGGVLVYFGATFRGGAAGIESVARSFLKAANDDG